jgi:Flp pilus assembly protein TadB
LFIDSAPFTAIGMVGACVGWYQTYKEQTAIDEALSSKTPEEKQKKISNVITLLTGKSDAYLKRTYNINFADKDDFLLIASEAMTNNAKGEALLEHLKERATANIRSKKLMLLASLISVIAIAIFFFTPLAPVGYALSAVAGIFAIALYVQDRRRSKQPLINFDPA